MWKKGDIKGAFASDKELLKPMIGVSNDAEIIISHSYFMKLHVNLPTGDSGGEVWTGIHCLQILDILL